MNQQIDLKSGAVLTVGPVPFADATKLFKTVANELKGVQVDIGGDLSNWTKKDFDLNSIKNLIFQLLGSDAVEACFFQCAIRSLYNGVKIDKNVFEAESARADYLPVAWEVIKATLSPFFKNLDLASLTKDQPNTKGPLPK